MPAAIAMRRILSPRPVARQLHTWIKVVSLVPPHHPRTTYIYANHRRMHRCCWLVPYMVPNNAMDTR